jgi:hypothetical protein
VRHSQAPDRICREERDSLESGYDDKVTNRHEPKRVPLQSNGWGRLLIPKGLCCRKTVALNPGRNDDALVRAPADRAAALQVIHAAALTKHDRAVVGAWENRRWETRLLFYSRNM